MQWYEWLHLLILLFLVVWACVVIDVPDVDEEGNYVNIKTRFRIALIRIFTLGD